MGTGTKVHEFTVLVERDGFAFRDVVETTEFEGFLAPFLDDLYRLFARDFLPAEGLVLFDDLGHFGLDALEIFRSKFVVEIEIVIESGVGRRSDIELRLGKKTEHCGGQNVRARVAQFFEGSHG
jgi:hypothetical protein